MATEKIITTGNSAGNPAPFKVPTVTIPDDAQYDKTNGWCRFTIQTPEGAIKAHCGWRAEYRGSVDALVAAGLMLPEWAPGLPGNNTMHQSVAIDAEGPRLILGKRRGKQMGAPHIIVKRVSSRSYEVVLPVTSAQKEKWEMGMHEINAHRHAQSVPAAPMAPEIAHARYCGLADNAIAWLREQMAATGCAYTPESMNQVDRSFEALRSAFADGRVVPVKPAYQRNGNVIHFPRLARAAATA